MKFDSIPIPRIDTIKDECRSGIAKMGVALRNGFGRPNMPYYLSVIAFFEAWISVVSIDALVIGTSLVRKKNGLMIAVLAALGGALGSTLLVAAIVQIGQHGPFSGFFQNSSLDSRAIQFYQNWGIFAVGFWAITFIPFQPFSFIYGTLMCLDLKHSNGTFLSHLIPFFSLAFAGRSLKYFVLTLLCIQFPEKAKAMMMKTKIGKYVSK